jgi:AAA+ ATPase superfamily predicted ATPase
LWYNAFVPTVKLLDRESEVSRLQEAWRQASLGQPQLVVVWGRRRVGKTFLLSHFLRGKRGVFFGATQQSQTVELARLAEAVRRDLGEQVSDLAGGGFTDWETALRFFVAVAGQGGPFRVGRSRLGGEDRLGGGKPLVLVFDEVPYLARSTPGFPSIVQAVWDHIPPGTRLMLVLTGSAVGVMEEIQGAGGALRGRPTATLRVDPVDLLATRRFLPDLGPSQLVEAYAACGGYPLHLLAWDQKETTEKNLARLAGIAGGILLEDASSILHEELPETGGYNRILAAVGRGASRFSEIAAEAHQRVEHPLEVLTRTGFLRKAVPVGAPRGAQPQYEIGDPYLAFWFGVLFSDIPSVEAGQGKQVLRRKRPQWQKHVGWMFEEAARAHARRLVAEGRLPGDLVIGRWWATTGGSCEVDVLGLRGSRTHLLGEARWQERLMGMRELEELRRKASRVPHPDDELLYGLWGRGGVRPEVTRAGALGFNLEAVLSG